MPSSKARKRRRELARSVEEIDKALEAIETADDRLDHGPGWDHEDRSDRRQREMRLMYGDLRTARNGAYAAGAPEGKPYHGTRSRVPR